ncbi:MAG: zf-HC2 domain-containing protein [Chloroflexota bacterium]|nr:zf-HC2 domain-containing protein [Chloroflexota bacterium]
MAAMSSPSQAEPCPLTDEDLVAYADGELAEAHRSLLEAHLAVCSVCQCRLAAFRETGRLLRENTPLIDDPASRATIRMRCVARSDQRRAAWPNPGLAALALLLFLSLVGERGWIERGGSSEVVGRATESAGSNPAAPVPQATARSRHSVRGYAAFAVCESPRFPAASGYGGAREAAGQGCAFHRTTQCASPYASSYAGGGVPRQAYTGTSAVATWTVTGCPIGWRPGLGSPSFQAGIARSFPGQALARTGTPAWAAAYGSVRGFGAGL